MTLALGTLVVASPVQRETGGGITSHCLRCYSARHVPKRSETPHSIHLKDASFAYVIMMFETSDQHSSNGITRAFPACPLTWPCSLMLQSSQEEFDLIMSQRRELDEEKLRIVRRQAELKMLQSKEKQANEERALKIEQGVKIKSQERRRKASERQGVFTCDRHGQATGAWCRFASTRAM